MEIVQGYGRTEHAGLLTVFLRTIIVAVGAILRSAGRPPASTAQPAPPSPENSSFGRRQDRYSSTT